METCKHASHYGVKGKMKEVVVIIPTYKPDKKIMRAFMEKLEKNFENIVIDNLKYLFINIPNKGIMKYKNPARSHPCISKTALAG